MRSVFWGLLALLIIIGIGYIVVNSSTKQSIQSPSGITPKSLQEYTVKLSEQNNSGESGTATLSEKNGKVKVVLQLTGTPQDVNQPAHIHVGSCQDLGIVKYSLTSAVNGLSETVLDITLEELRNQQPLGINVHKSETEHKVYVSCGNLTL